MLKNGFGAFYSRNSEGKYYLSQILFGDYNEETNEVTVYTGNRGYDKRGQIDFIKTNPNDFLKVPNKVEISGETDDALIMFEDDYLEGIIEKYDCEEPEALLILSNKLLKIMIEKNEDGVFMSKENDTELEFTLDDINTLYEELDKNEPAEYGMDVIDEVISQCLGTPAQVQSMNVKITLQADKKEKGEQYFKPNDDVFKELDGIKKNVIDKNKTNTVSPLALADVKKVISETSKKIVGQESTIKTLVNQIYNNQMIIDDVLKNGELDVTELDSRKASILLDGETGTGKTAILKDIAKQLGLPIVIASSTNFSGTGYVGASVTDLLKDLLDQADGNLNMAERGIIVFDEVDKLAFQKNAAAGVDMKEEVQHELLTFIGGGEYEVPVEGFPFGKDVKFNTSKNTFILSGAFTNLREDKINSVKKAGNVMGFSAETPEVKNEYTVTPDDYIKYGLMREFFGRIKVLTSTKSYNIDDCKNILLNSKISPLTNLEKTVKMYGYKGITYTDEFLNKVAEEGLAMHTGARGLQTVMSGILNNMLDALINEEFDKDKPIELNESLISDYKKIFTRKF